MDRQLGLPALVAAMVTAISGFCLSYALGQGQDEISLVENGQSGYTIVIAADAPLPVKFAAEELQKYLVQISGARLPVCDRTPPRSWRSAWERAAYRPTRGTSCARDLKDRGEDGYLMCSSGKRLVLTGNSPRATLYAVYHFLEKYLGCGWCAPGDDTVPKQATIRIPQFQDAVGPPAFAMRDRFDQTPILRSPAYGADFMRKCNLPQIDWLAKNRFNWAHPGPNGPYSGSRTSRGKSLFPRWRSGGCTWRWAATPSTPGFRRIAMPRIIRTTGRAATSAFPIPTWRG